MNKSLGPNISSWPSPVLRMVLEMTSQMMSLGWASPA
jgi:hypothetical protein